MSTAGYMPPILRTYQWMYLAEDGEDQIMPGMHDLVVGTKIGLDFIAHVLQAVEPGEYCKDATGRLYLTCGQEDLPRSVVYRWHSG